MHRRGQQQRWSNVCQRKSDLSSLQRKAWRSIVRVQNRICHPAGALSATAVGDSPTPLETRRRRGWQGLRNNPRWYAAMASAPSSRSAALAHSAGSSWWAIDQLS